MNASKHLSDKPLTLLFEIQDGDPVTSHWIREKLTDQAFAQCLEQNLIEKCHRDRDGDILFVITDLGKQLCQGSNH